MIYKILAALTEAISWLGIFFSPVLFFGVVAAFIYFPNPERLWIAAVIAGIGVLLGVIWAESIRRKYGCTNYMSRIMSSGGK